MQQGLRQSDADAILVRTPNWIGDAVFSIPALRALATTFPNVPITLLGPSSVCELLAAVEGVSNVTGYSSAGARHRLGKARKLRCLRAGIGVVLPDSFSSALEMWVAGARNRLGRAREARSVLLNRRIQYSSPPRTRHVVDEYLEIVEGIGAVTTDRTPRLPLLESAVEHAARLFPSKSSRSSSRPSSRLRIGMVPGAAYGPAKRWALENWVDLAGRFEDAEIVLFGSAEEGVLAEAISSRLKSGAVVLAGRTDTPTLAACLSMCSLVIGNDTGPAHLASAVGTPVVFLFGSTNPVWTGPRNGHHRLVQSTVECAPCYQRECDRGYACLLEITVEKVWQACKDLLNSGIPADEGANTAVEE